MAPTLATPGNMKEAKRLGKRCFAWSPITFEHASAEPGDYFNIPDHLPITDTDGYAMMLAVKVTRYIDPMNGTDLLVDHQEQA